MSDWGIALISTGSVLAGSLITGWYTRTAGSKQAEAARHAGDRQADALLDTVRMTLEDGRAVRLLDLRRQTYVQFLEAAGVALLARRTGRTKSDDGIPLSRALAAVELEGPVEAAQAARAFVGALRGNPSLEELDRLRETFVSTARDGLARDSG